MPEFESGGGSGGVANALRNRWRTPAQAGPDALNPWPNLSQGRRSFSVPTLVPVPANQFPSQNQVRQKGRTNQVGQKGRAKIAQLKLFMKRDALPADSIPDDGRGPRRLNC